MSTDDTERRFRRSARPALRIGWLAKGALFVIIGALALELARRGWASDDPDQAGALRALAGTPFGRAGVAVVSVGLLLYSAWQVWAAFIQDEDGDVGAGTVVHVVQRVGWVGLALVYGILAVSGLELAARGADAVSSGDEEEGATTPAGVTRLLLDVAGGRVLVVLLGLGTIGVGLYQLTKGLQRKFLDDIDTSGLGRNHRRALTVVGTAGFTARSLLMVVAGWLFIDAARFEQPKRAAGIADSLQALAGAPAGQALLTTCAFGLIAAGIYDMATFRRQRIEAAAP